MARMVAGGRAAMHRHHAAAAATSDLGGGDRGTVCQAGGLAGSGDRSVGAGFVANPVVESFAAYAGVLSRAPHRLVVSDIPVGRVRSVWERAGLSPGAAGGCRKLVAKQAAVDERGG